MWEWIIIPMLTMAIGFLMGVVVADGAGRNMQLEELRKEIRRLKNGLQK